MEAGDTMAEASEVRDAAPSPDTEETPLATRAVRGGLWVMAGSYWTIGFGFAVNLVLTRILAPEAFGVFALATFFAQLLRLQPKLGLRYAFAREKQLTDETVGTYIIADAGSVLAGFVITAAIGPILVAFGYDPSLIWISVILAFSACLEGFASIAGTLLDRELVFGATSAVQSAGFTLSYIPAVWIAVNGGGVWALVTQSLVYNTLLALGVWAVLRRWHPAIWRLHWRFSGGIARQYLGFGVTAGVGTMAAVLLLTLDDFLIGTFVGVAVLGFYDRAYRTAQWPSQLLNALVARTLFYVYAKVRDDRERLRLVVEMVLWVIGTAALPLALMVLVAAPDLVTLLYGERWLPSALFLRILVVYSVLRPVWENASTLFIAIGKPRLNTQLVFGQVAILAVLGLPMTLAWEAIGTCIAVGCAFVVGIVVMYRVLIRDIAISAASAFGIPCMIGVGVVLGYLGLSYATGLNGLPLITRLLLKLGYTVVVFYGLTALLQYRATLGRISYFWGALRGS